MSYSALSGQYAGRAFQGQTYSEVFLQEHQQNTNLVYGSQNKVLDSRIMKIHSEWSQAFDLGEASLIVMVHANQMRMKLIHFTESHLAEYQNMVLQGREKLPELQGMEKVPTSFMMTDESQKNNIRTVFEKLSTAQLVVEGIIVPNIVLTYQKNPLQAQNGAHKQVYTLSFVTSLRKLYQIDFDSYFFKANQNIIVNGPRDLDINGTVTSFDLATSMKTNGIIYQFIIGTTISQANSTTYEQVKQQMEDTLFFLKGTPSQGYTIEKISQQADLGIVQNVKQAFLKTKMADILQNAASTQFFLGNAFKGAQQTGLQTQLRGGLEEGVVFVKQLTNSMVAVIYTTGWLRIWSTESERCIKEHNILGYDDEITDLTSFQFRDKIVRAKLDFHKRDFWMDEFAINFDIAVAYSVRTISQSSDTTLGHSGYEFTWHVTQLQMQVSLHDKMRALVDETNESIVDFSNVTLATLEINLNQTIKLIPNEDVVDLLYECEQKQYRSKELHLWLITSIFEEESQCHRGKIVDLKSEVQRIWDRECQMKYENMLDYLDVPEELLNKHSRFSERIATHYIKRILAKGRFQPQVLADIVASYDNQKDSHVDEERLQRIAFAPTGLRDLRAILKDCKMCEQQNSKLIGFSRQMKNHAYRVVIRQIGVSIVKPVSYYQSIYLRESLASLQLNKIENDTLQLSQIKQFFPLNESLDDELLITLMGAIRYLHLNSLELIDESLLKCPENGVQSLLSVLLREQYANQALLFEIGKSLEPSRDKIEDQLNQTIIDILSFLNQNSQTSQNDRTSFVPTGRHPSQLFSLPLLKMVERGLSYELDSLYNFIRDLLLVKAFLELNNPNLSRYSVQFDQQEYNLSTLEAWLIQLASLRRILKMNFSYDQLQYSRSKCRGETESLLKSLSNQFANEPHTYLTYLILKRYHQSSSIGLWKRSISLLAEDANLGRRQNFNDLYIDFLKGNLFHVERDNSSSDLIYPNFARTLLKLKKWNLIIEYLEPMLKSELQNYQTLQLELAYAIARANSGDQASEFANRIRNCILLYKQSEDFVAVNVADFIFDSEKSMAAEIIEYVSRATASAQLQFYLTIALQLKSLDPRYELFVLLSALKEPNISSIDSDMLNERLFNTAKQISLNNGGGIDFMYEALIKTLGQEQRQRMIGEFLLYYCNISQKGFKCQSSLHFSHDDIDLAEAYLVNKLESEFPKEATVNVSQVLQVLGLILSIGETYSRQIETARYLWLLNQRVESLINQCQRYDKLRPYQAMLRLQQYILKHLYISALTLGDHLLILDDSAVRQKNSNNIDPSIQRRARPSGQDEMQESPEDYEERILQQGLSFFKSDKYYSIFPSGYLTRITQEDLRKCLLTSEARLKCSEMEITKEADRLVKILSEIKEFDLAVELALASRKPTDTQSLVAYPIMSMLCEYEKALEKKNESHLEDTQMVAEDEEKSNDETIFNLKQMTLIRNNDVANKDFNKDIIIASYFERIISRLIVSDLLEIVKALVSQKIAIPKLLQQKIIEHGQLKFLLEFYLSEEFLNITAALDLLTNGDISKNVKELADVDLQLLVTFIEILDQSLNDNSEQLIELKNDEEHRIKVLTNGRDIDDFTISQDFGDDLQDFLGVDSKQLFAQVMDRKDIEKGNDAELDLIRVDIETTQTFINSLRDSIPQIKGTLAKYLNGQ